MEIAQLPPDEGRVFLEDLGIRDSAMMKLFRTSYSALGLISFFTVGKNEGRAWTIKTGTTALEAAGKIHSDMERGFIRAEAVGFEDFRAVDFTMGKAREKGLVRLEGKTYVVQDGDIINFKFNV
jgi:ribosome-binding ATPase YchF (GTP1/OBG family)